MLTKAVDTYIAMRRACGFAFQTEGTYLRGFAAYAGFAILRVGGRNVISGSNKESDEAHKKKRDPDAVLKPLDN
jgi:hypothetical protein